MNASILTLPLETEKDIVSARQQARQIASLLGIEARDQTRLATAVSEIVRNAFKHGGGGKAEFILEGDTTPQALLIRITDAGPGIDHPGQGPTDIGAPAGGMGLIYARRLVDQFKIESKPGEGTVVELQQHLPKTSPAVNANRLTIITEQLNGQRSQDPYDEIQRQNLELMRTLDELRRRHEDLVRLNQELADTNRGVVALTMELEDKAESLRHADEMKSRFLSYMSHEFRTPLNSILALARLLLDRSDGELTTEQETQVSFISRSAGELTELVNDLLDLAKIEAGKIEVHPTDFEVANLFSALRGMLRPVFSGEQVNLIFEEPKGLPPLHTDEGKVSQILRNFLSNALKFTERGEVRVSARPSPDGKTILFSVADTGIGIAPGDQERIFQEFIQVRSSMQTKVKGTGLGLPLCRKLAELLGGNVSVKSTLGAGATFSALIPVNFPTTSESERARRVLLIDDEEASRYVLKRLLSDQSLFVLEAVDGTSGLSLARAEQPQLIFLDLMMPDMVGTEVLARLKADSQTNDIPVVIVTSKALDNRERKHLLAHSTAVLSKAEISHRTLLPVLERIFGAGHFSAAARQIAASSIQEPVHSAEER